MYKTKWVCKQLIKHFGEMNLSSMHVTSSSYLQHGPLLSIIKEEVSRFYFFCNIKFHKVYYRVTKMNSIVSHYKQSAFLTGIVLYKGFFMQIMGPIIHQISRKTRFFTKLLDFYNKFQLVAKNIEWSFFKKKIQI